MFAEAKGSEKYRDADVYIDSIGYKTSDVNGLGNSFYAQYLGAKKVRRKTGIGTLKEFFVNLTKSPIDFGNTLIAYDKATPDELDAINQAIADKFHTSVDSVRNCLSDKNCHNRFTLAMLQTSVSDSNQLGLNILTTVVPAGAAAKAVRGADIGTSIKVLGSALDFVYATQRPVEEVFPELKGVNSHYVENAGPGINTNCGSCTVATYKRLTGEDSAAIADASKYVKPTYFDSIIPGTIRNLDTESATKFLLRQSDGTAGIVLIDQGKNAVMHAINFVKKDGQVYFIDSQIGKIVTLQPGLRLELGIPIHLES